MQTRPQSSNIKSAGAQNRLAARLRGMPEERAYGVIRGLISRDPKVGLGIANRILRDRTFLETILRDGLRVSNESTCRFWLESLAPRLGARRLVQIIREEAATAPAIAAKALYWLPSIFSGDGETSLELQRMRQEFTPSHT